MPKEKILGISGIFEKEIWGYSTGTSGICDSTIKGIWDISRKKLRGYGIPPPHDGASLLTTKSPALCKLAIHNHN